MNYAGAGNTPDAPVIDGALARYAGHFLPVGVPHPFWSRIQIIPDGCWLWQGPKNRKGYGRVFVGGKSHRVHRLSYEIHTGPIPAGLTIDHLCRVRNCVNPEHLRAVTNKENVLAGDGPTAQNARKSHCKHGHPLTGPNLIVRPGKGRRCKQCKSDGAKRSREANRVVLGPSGNDAVTGEDAAPSVCSQLQHGGCDPLRPPCTHSPLVSSLSPASSARRPSHSLRSAGNL